MKLRLDPTACRGHGRCYSLAPELFDCDDDGQAILKARAGLATDVRDAARLVTASCPEFAITVED